MKHNVNIDAKFLNEFLAKTTTVIIMLHSNIQ